MITELRQAAMVLLACTVVAGCAPRYSAEEIEAWVVDADTGQPLEGVNVVAHWSLEFGWEGGSQHDLEMMETVTDRQGRFHFPAWGPKPFPKGVPWDASLQNQDPEIILFKPEYWVRAIYNNRNAPPYRWWGPKVRKSLWDGKRIPLKRFPGDWELYGRAYASSVVLALTGMSYSRCEWKKMPRMIVALDREVLRLEQMGVKYLHQQRIDDLAAAGVDAECGSVREFFRGYLDDAKKQDK